LNHLIKLSKRNYYNNYFFSKSGNSRDIWKGIKDLVTTKLHKHHAPTIINDNGLELNDPKAIANAFNKFFSTIGTNLASKITNVHKSPMEYMINSSSDSFFLSPTTATEIENEISYLNNSKSTGPFSIPTPILKLAKNVLSGPLAIIINASFATGIVPKKMKIAKVIPVFKKGSSTQLTNYRPISLLSVFNKILEKLMHKRLYSYINEKQILYSKQFGFRASYSTSHALISIIDKIQVAIENRDFICGVFIDLSKAFDTVDHNILLKKLDFYGIRGLPFEWFTSYLSNRKQFVCVDNVFSDELHISCGVPQGSVLGPLLFLIYINDFSLCSKLLDFHLFADDANLFYKDNTSNFQTNLNSELDKVYVWLCSNKLSLNVSKSNFVIFHSRQRKIDNNLEIFINHERLNQEQSIKYLGIMIDSNLSWKSHINYTAKKVKRNIGIISKLRNYVSLSTLKRLYYALVYPFLTYGILVWGCTYQTTLQPLFILQKKAVRILTNSSFHEHTSPLFKDMNFLKLCDLVSFHIALFTYKFHNQLLPPIFDSFFSTVASQHNHGTRLSSKQSFLLPKARTNYGIFNIRFQGAQIWNSIAENVKFHSLKKFKLIVKETFLQSY
jgi:hypothetical protein